jgi:hypothetical protein
LGTLQQWGLRLLLAHNIDLGSCCCNIDLWCHCAIIPFEWGLRSLLAHSCDHGSHRCNSDLRYLVLLFLLSKSDLWPQFLCTKVINRACCWHHWPCCGVNTTFEITFYSKEYTFLILLSLYCVKKTNLRDDENHDVDGWFYHDAITMILGYDWWCHFPRCHLSVIIQTVHAAIYHWSH